jgi:glycosyltransferase involved in cell wall biosynthesis
MNSSLSCGSENPEGLSCLLSVYAKEDPLYLEEAIESILQQTRRPDELVVVEDGPLPANLRDALDACGKKLPTLRVRLESNVGLGLALAQGLRCCNFDLVARMDADDIARPARFERQAKFMRANPEALLLGSTVEEFRFRPGDLARFRRTPETDEAIRRRARIRNPFNHMSVIFRKQPVDAVGGYRHRPGFEDYDLWLRLLKQPGRLANLGEVLVDVRVGNGMLSRRRGVRYLQSELGFLWDCRQQNLISTVDMARSAFARIPARLAPVWVLERIYDAFLRERERN